MTEPTVHGQWSHMVEKETNFEHKTEKLVNIIYEVVLKQAFYYIEEK